MPDRLIAAGTRGTGDGPGVPPHHGHGYRWVDVAVLRAPAYSLDAAALVGSVPEPIGDLDRDATRMRSWIRQVWSTSWFADAVSVAAPDLAARIVAVTATAPPPRDVTRIGGALYRYLLRARHRATPFGLFAGVAAVHIGGPASWRVGEDHRVVVHPDSAWLSEVVRRLEQHLTAMPQVTVVADATIRIRDGGLVVPCRSVARGAASVPGETTIRLTPPIETVLNSARTPIAVADLVERLRARFPDVDTDRVGALLRGLVEHGVLLSALRAPTLATDPLMHVLSVVNTALTGVEPRAVTSMVDELHAVHAARCDVRSPRDAACLVNRTGKPGSAPGRGGSHWAMHLGLDIDASLPVSIAHDAQTAATLLAALTPLPNGIAAWSDYHQRVLDRYGPGILVSLLDLVDPDTGLGFPTGYRGGDIAHPRPSAPPVREAVLLGLLQQAALDRVHEVELTDDVLARLTPTTMPLPVPHLDLRFRIHARDLAALDRREHTLVVTGMSPSAGATVGRFLPLLDPVNRAGISSAYAALPTATPDALPVQVSSPPLHPRTGNVAHAPQVWPDVIAVAEHLAGAALALDDLAVAANDTGLRLIHTPTGRVVEPAVFTAVEHRHHTHPLVRFLTELPRATRPALVPFSWGSMVHAPFTPRVRRGRIVLAVATWRLTTNAAAPTASITEWDTALARWRHRWDVPRIVEVGDDDERLTLDLDRRADQDLLRRAQRQTGNLIVRETAAAADHGWSSGRACEITLALVAPSPDPRTTTRTRFHWTGSQPGRVVSCLIHAHRERHPTLLAEHLPRLHDDMNAPGPSWFTRTEDGVRCWWAFDDLASDVGDLVARTTEWAVDVRHRGVLREITWTVPAAISDLVPIPVAEVCSATALAVHRTAKDDPDLRTALVVADLFDLSTAVADGVATLLDRTDLRGGPAPDRVLRIRALRLATDPSAIAALAGGTELIAAWRCRAAHLSHDTDPGPLDRLLRAQHRRMIGPDPEHERLCLRLIRDAARSRAHTNQSVTAQWKGAS